MPDTADYSYEGNVALKVGGRLPEIEVLSIEHLIPINVRARVNGVETVASAFIDYSTEAVHVPDAELAHVVNADIFKAAVLRFLHEREEREVAEQQAAEADMAAEHYRLMQAQQARAAAWAAAMPDDEDDE